MSKISKIWQKNNKLIFMKIYRDIIKVSSMKIKLEIIKLNIKIL